jgi:hypothetical protein
MSVSAKTLRPIMTAQIDRATKLMTDDAGQYQHMGKRLLYSQGLAG